MKKRSQCNAVPTIPCKYCPECGCRLSDGAPHTAAPNPQEAEVKQLRKVLSAK